MKSFVAIIPLVVLLAACGEDGSDNAVTNATTLPKQAVRQSNLADVQKGFKVYQKNCASCHGSEGQGAPNWQQAAPDGKYPPPPLNGTGHAWHHPYAALVRTIKHGTITIGGNMPGWSGKLADDEIAAVITWFQSRWPDELYQAWSRMDQRTQKK
jgi:mono/diheme cytochrome c family protein